MLLLVSSSVFCSYFGHNSWSNKTGEPGADIREVVVEVHHGEEGVGAGPAAVDVVGETHQTEHGLPAHFLWRLEVHRSTGEEGHIDAVAQDLVSQ